MANKERAKKTRRKALAPQPKPVTAEAKPWAGSAEQLKDFREREWGLRVAFDTAIKASEGQGRHGKAHFRMLCVLGAAYRESMKDLLLAVCKEQDGRLVT